MERRVAPVAALLVVLALAGGVFAAPSDPGPVTLAPVAWPVSTLLVSEVQTGGASASDEFAEITNVGPSAVDLAGLEIVYVTSTGSTVTRKASWAAATLLGAGRHLFIANTSGIYAGLADATYSGGLAATGGSIVLRVIGGAPIDSVGWGDATNSFVEGSPAPAPAAGSSIERKPGGLAGNTTDTNANATDWFGQASPNPQAVAAPPVPAPGASPAPTSVPTPSPTEAPTASPSPTEAPLPTAEPTATPMSTDAIPTETPSATPTASPSETPLPTSVIDPSPEATAAPTAAPTATPAPTASPEPTPQPTPAVTPTAAPEATPVPTATPLPTATSVPAISIAAARSQANGTTATITGVLTTQLGALESARKAFVQDQTGGIALYLDAAVADGLAAGTQITVSGTVDDRFAERTLRVAVADIVSLGVQAIPGPSSTQTGAIVEAVEGSRVLVQGATVGSATDLSDGLGLMVDDGSGQVRLIVSPAALGGLTVPSGTLVSAAGPVGQRDSSGTGLAGYRIHATEAGAFAILVQPTPTPSATPAPSASLAPTALPSPSATPSPTPAPSPAPSPNPSSTPAPTAKATATPLPTPSANPTPTSSPGPTVPSTLSIVEARGVPAGGTVTITGVVTAESGQLGLPPLIAIADGTGGIVLRLPAGVASPARGKTVLATGKLADPYGQLELRPARNGFKVTGQGSQPTALQLTAKDLGEATEGRVATLTGTVKAAPQKGTNGSLSIELVDAAGTGFRVVTGASSQVLAAHLVKGSSYLVTGVVGQRASRKGTLDGYRLYVRDRADITRAMTGPVGPGGPGPSGAPTTITRIAMVLALGDGSPVTVEATVTAGVRLLDSSGRRIVVQDASGAIEVLLPAGTPSPTVGARLRIVGATGHAWGAPRIVATSVGPATGGSAVGAASLGRVPAERDEWLLVRLSGTILKVERLGERWRAEIQLANGAKVPINGQAGAAIPSTAILTGRRITVTGIVKRPYPTASDRRFALLPRNGGDVSIAGVSGGTGDAAGSQTSGAGTSGPGESQAPSDLTPDTDLAALQERVGDKVRVGGLIAKVTGDGFDLDDGTALAHVQLTGDMAALLPHLRVGEPVAASGVVQVVAGAPTVVVGDDGTLLRVGSLGEALPIGGAAADAGPSPSAGDGTAARAADSAGIGSGLAPTSLLAMLGISVLSVLATLIRRRLVRRRLRTALVSRLATLRPTDG